MENNNFRSVAFGGFDRQDVISYIERTAREAAAAQEALRRENDELRQEREALSSQLATLRYQMETLRAEHARVQTELDRETAARQELEALRPQAERLSAEAEALRSDAGAYARFRERIGAIECEARQRAATLEDETNGRLRQVTEHFRTQYQTLMDSFEAAASHVSGELRKIEVSLAQLPRAMDQSGAELDRLAALLEQDETAE